QAGGEQPDPEAARAPGAGAQGMSRTRRFPGELRAVPMARAFVREALEGSDPELAAEALIVASELAANAVVHAGSEFAVTVAATDDRVCLSVADSGGGRPSRRTSEATDEAGRGLQLVDALASRWGVASGWLGKVVWAEVDAA
ncbi:MAG TPA: ATP-binding protein, partial [Acidimicrobiales bacterium]|nr:ATP-binding protein [Acidimicrobiales bacterium]